MVGREDSRRVGALDELAALLEETEAGAEHGPGGGRAEAHEHFGPHDLQLPKQPGPARLDLAAGRRLVDAALPRSLELEVLDGVGHEDVPARDLRLRERPVEDRSGRPDERMALQIFLVARLLADEDEPRAARAFAEDRLGGLAIEVAAAALLNRARKSGEVPRRRNPAFRSFEPLSYRRGSHEPVPCKDPAGTAPRAVTRKGPRGAFAWIDASRISMGWYGRQRPRRARADASGSGAGSRDWRRRARPPAAASTFSTLRLPISSALAGSTRL